jgi:PST family polysaccharide transporter
MTVWVYLAEGQTKRQFTWTLISMPLTIAGTIAGVPWGAVGIATGYAGTVSLLVIPAVILP